MIVLGLTGSIGMGKSTLAAMLETLGIPVHNADTAVHELLSPGGKGLPAFQAVFPRVQWPGAYNEDGSINRKNLGDVLFRNGEALSRLEQILHPLVHEAQKEFLHLQKDRGCKIAVLDIPLLFETGGEKRVNYTVVVTAPYIVQRTRVLARPGMDRKKFRAILKRQLPDRQKRARADFVIQTGFGRNHTLQKLQAVLAEIRAKEGI